MIGLRAIQEGVAALTLCLTIAGSPVQACELPADRQARLEAAIDSAVAEGRAAGVSVAVLHDEHLVFSHSAGLADLERNASATSATVYRIASLTKQFTAAGVLLLAEQGRLSIDDQLSVYMPDFPRADEVTLRDLINHTAGVHNYTESDAADRISDTGATVPELISAIAGQDPLYDFAPGTMWHYSNSNYALLGAVIEKVSGQTYAQFMKVTIFDRLGMADTAVDDNGAIAPRRASGYSLTGGQPGAYRHAGHLDMSVPYAAGAIRSTVADLARWNAALYGGRLLSAASLAQMTGPGLLRNGAETQTAVYWPGEPGVPPEGLIPGPYAFGLDHYSINGHRVVGHNGSLPGFDAVMNVYPDDDMTIIVLTNTSGAAGQLEWQLSQIVLDAR
ncbi:beta-lactamase family protein [Sphingorhabdus soli]|uniref:Beta-lactamase family protein n=1 Tax=Flavisphingopyxis soli TaxID=2601267 RepID=A0A5C6U8U6_9SPHN|nr:serine hydrolase domain-containing protein [Sphingorhabdus soli]TXC68820.1 beta-lactamase family protein [Sphingorhabdus soli]